MGKVYVGQTDLTIQLETKKDLSGITNVKIVFEKPDGTKGEFTASVIDIPKGIIQYAITSLTDIDQAGSWTFWAKIINTQGLVSIGEPFFVLVYKQGN